MATALATAFSAGTAATTAGSAALVGAEAAAAGGGLAAASAGLGVAAPTAATVATGAGTIGAAATAFGEAASRISALDVISGAAQGFGALSSVRAAEFRAASVGAAADLAAERARQERLRALQEGNVIRERLIRSIAQQNAAAAASGIDIASGSIQSGIRASIGQAERELSVAEQSSRVRRLARRSRARQLRIDARAARAGGTTRAIGGLLEFGRRRFERGTVPA